MAEFPHPEYRNLWRGSKLSKDRSAIGGQAGNDWVQTEDSFSGTIKVATSTAYSLLYTSSAYRVPVESNKPYSWLIPVRNPGSMPFNLSISTWLERSTSGSEGQSFNAVLQPGETRYVKFEGLQSDVAKDIRFSIYYNTNDLKPVVGSQVELLDGITLVQSATAPPFPFNGDGAMPVETVKRRNLAKYPVGPATTGRTGWTISPGGEAFNFIPADGGLPALEVMDSAGGENAYIDPNERLSPEVGKWVALGIDTKALDAFRADNMRLRIASYSGASTAPGPSSVPSSTDRFVRGVVYAQITAYSASGYLRTLIWPAYGSDGGPVGGFRFRNAVLAVADTQAAAEAAVATYFDGDTPASGNLSYHWAPDGTSLEVETIQPPSGRTVVWDGEPYKSTSTLWVGDSIHATGVMDIGAATDARLGIVSDIYSRSQEKIKLVLATPDENLVSGRRVELSAAAYTATPVVWRWRQVTGPAVDLEPRDNNADFIAPDVDEETTIRIGVYAISEDGRNRSDWHYFDLSILPPTGRFLLEGTAEYVPTVPSIVGYGRGRREVWNDVVRPAHFWANPRNEVEVVDLGITPDDVQFSVEQPESCAAGGVYINPETGDVFRNFGAGYNETNDTTGAPRTNAYWLNPATGDILEWRGA